MEQQKLRSRNLGALTNYEAEQYLQRNDVIFIPVGTFELHGPLPLDCEYVLAEAVAYQLAEACDGLVLPHMAYFHPGATDTGRGTVYMSMTDGFSYIRAIAQSLLNQGFRRQIYLTAHGPSFMTVLPMITQFLDETKVPLFYGDMMTLLNEAGMDIPFAGGGLDDMILGAYKYLNRLEDVPLNMNLPEIVFTPESDTSNFIPKSTIEHLFPKSGGYFTAWKIGNLLEHGGSCHSPESIAERDERASHGVAMIKEFVEKLHFQTKLDALRDLDQFHQNTIVPKYGQWLVRNKYPDPNK